MAENEGIHTIPIFNSSAKCLMENWVEERAAAHLDSNHATWDKRKRGHKGILSLNEETCYQAQTTTQTAYMKPSSNVPPTSGPRNKLKERFFLNTALSTSKSLDVPIVETPPLTSEYRDNINIPSFRTKKPELIHRHSLYGEIPVSYWTEKTGTTGIHGVSQVKTRDTPFRKNTAFSKPIQESMNQPMPFEFELYPNM